VSAYYVTTGNHALYQARPYFPLAATELKQQKLGGCGYTEAAPIGESQTHVNLDELDFSDPPHTSGTGNPSGGRYTAIGVELFDSLYEASKGGAVENASTATCTLASSRRHFCAAILRVVRSEFQHLLKTTR
jgi:hypothetical protein